MKFTKLILLTACVLAVATSAFAQKSGVYTQLAGGATAIPTLTTNQFVVSGVTNQAGAPASDSITSSNLIQTVAEYNSVGLTWQFTYPTGSTNGAVTLFIYRSFDNGVTYEANPGFTYAVTPVAPGNGTWTTNLSIATTDATHLGFSVENKAVGYITNCNLKINLKSPKYGAKASTQ